MDNKIEKAILFCIEAFNNRERGSREVKVNSEFVLATLKEIMQLPYQGRNLGFGAFGYADYRSSFESMKLRFEKDSITHSLGWLDALLVLFDFANYDEETMLQFAEKIVNDNIMYNHVLKHIITNCVVMNDVEKALKFIPNFRTTKIFKEQDNLDTGFLIVLKHHAMKGDDQNFFKYFKQSKPTVNKTEINDAKGFLVKNYAQRNGIEQTIALCNHKNLGPKFYFNALMAFAEQGKYQELKQVFQKYPEFSQPELETELNILSTAFLNAKKINIITDDDFEQLFERALKVDRKLKWGDAKLQDSILFDLGLASAGNKERISRCKKAIKSNSLKRELASM